VRPPSLRRVGVAVSTGRVSSVFLEGRRVVGWYRSTDAYNSPETARQVVRRWLPGFRADQALIADTASSTVKGPRSRCLIEAIAEEMADAPCLDLRVRRTQRHANKYDEAAALARRYPPMASILPKPPPIWLPEPRNMGYFEALALVDAVDQTDPEQTTKQP